MAVGLEGALLGVTEPEARARLVETLGLVRHAVAVRPLLALAGDGHRGRAGARRRRRRPRPASGRHRRRRPARRLAAVPTSWRTSPGSPLVDLGAAASWRRDTARDGLTVAQLFLHADIDALLSSAGAGDNGGIATLLVRLGDALVAATGGTGWNG